MVQKTDLVFDLQTKLALIALLAELPVRKLYEGVKVHVYKVQKNSAYDWTHIEKAW